MEQSKEFLKNLVTEIVENKEAVSVDASTDEMGVLLVLHVAQEDMGKVIGREGNTAKAIRTLVRVVGMQQNARVNMKIAEPGN